MKESSACGIVRAKHESEREGYKHERELSTIMSEACRERGRATHETESYA